MKGKMVTFNGNGQNHDGYFSAPENGAPGVIVIQEYWGLVDHIKDITDRFASAGFAALAPDFYKGKKATSPDEAGKFFMALKIQEAEKVMRGAIDALLGYPECSSKTVGTVGFCMGGQLAMYAAAANPDKVSACVNFYGIHPNVNPSFENLKAPLLGHFAENDKSVNSKVVESLRNKLNSLGKKHEFHVYPGTVHAFFNDTRREVYDPKASAEAWKLTIDFLKQHVK
jgi:carboxymethylenebutenolidase